MQTNSFPESEDYGANQLGAESVAANPFAQLAPIPVTIEETGLGQSLLEDLVGKTLLETAVADLDFLSVATALSAPVLEQILNAYRADGRIEVRAAAGQSSGLRYALTDSGRNYARQAYERSGYVGPAPISLSQYQQLIQHQSVRNKRVTRSLMHEKMSDIVISPMTLDQLGAAMHSGKATFIHGHAGTGKSYICSRLNRLIDSTVLVPFAVAESETVVSVFDPSVHVKTDGADQPALMLRDRHDPRLCVCDRPFVTSGGELDADLLEVRYDTNTRQYSAPLQMKAINGIYLIDDLGRQKINPSELFNRWIVPMEAGIDYLNFGSGVRMEIPFDLLLIFSTNLDPADLVDAAFLRRIGHKIEMTELQPQEYKMIWRDLCNAKSIPYEESVVDFAIENLHYPNGMPLLACHPRDLIGAALDFIEYGEDDRRLTPYALELGWESNFLGTASAH